MNTKKWMIAAGAEALKSPMKDWKLGAILVRGGRIIGRGHNRTSSKSSLFEKKYKIRLWSLHAEMDAILSCDPRGSTLFISGFNSNGNQIVTRPCKYCMKILRAVGVKGVYYTNKEIVYEEI